MLVTANNSLVPKVTELVEQHDELEQANAKLADDPNKVRVYTISITS